MNQANSLVKISSSKDPTSSIRPIHPHHVELVGLKSIQVQKKKGFFYKKQQKFEVIFQQLYEDFLEFSPLMPKFKTILRKSVNMRALNLKISGFYYETIK